VAVRSVEMPNSVLVLSEIGKKWVVQGCKMIKKMHQ